MSSRPQTILFAVPKLPRASGVSVFACEIARELVDAGHEVVLAVGRRMPGAERPVDPRIPVCSESDALRGGRRFDVVHLHGLWSPCLHRLAAWGRRTGARVAWSPHGMLAPWALNHKFWKKAVALALYQRRDLVRADLLHVTSEQERGDLRRLRLVTPSAVVPLGVRLPDASSNVASPLPPAAGCRRTLLFAGRVQRIKGLPDLIAAWAALPSDERGGWRIRIVGPDEDGHASELVALRGRLGLSAEDVVFAGEKHGQALADEYALADLFALPSHSENFGGVVAEALAHGVPVIATKGTPWRVLREEGCGWWVDGGVDSLSAALHEALRLSDAERAAMGRVGRALVARDYTWRSAAEKLLAAYVFSPVRGGAGNEEDA